MLLNGIIRIAGVTGITGIVRLQARAMCSHSGIVHPETITDNLKKKTPHSVHSNAKIKQSPKTEEHALKVTLLSGENISVVSLAEAKRIATRRDLKLIKIVDMDTKSKRPIYRLMSGQEYFKEDVKQRLEKKEAKAKCTIKGEKLLTMSFKIGENDLKIKMNHLVKWLNKSYEVRIVIEGDSANKEASEQIYNQIEKEYGHHGRILQKRNKGGDVRFQMQPLKKENLQSEETNNLNEQTKGAVNVLKKEDDQITIQQTRAIHTSSSDNKSL